jgi:hypothetical protein
MPCFLAALAVATSPSAWNMRCPAHEVSKNGNACLWPRIAVLRGASSHGMTMGAKADVTGRMASTIPPTRCGQSFFPFCALLTAS